MKTSNTIKQIIEHRSIRSFLPKDIDAQTLDNILFAGIRAASSGNMQFYSVIRSTDPELKEKLYQAHGRQNMILEAPVVLTFCSDLNRLKKWMIQGKAHTTFNDFMSFLRGVVDVCLVAQNVAVAAESLGLGTCYMGSTLTNAAKLTEILSLPKQVMPITSMVLGHPRGESNRVERLDPKAVIHDQVYCDHSESHIHSIFEKKNQEALARFAADPKNASLIQEHGIETAAQFYATKKYGQDVLDHCSEDFLECLRTQFDRVFGQK
ncbi:MAG: nitroreductase family protein [Bdellovibrionota bacterium]